MKIKKLFNRNLISPYLDLNIDLILSNPSDLIRHLGADNWVPEHSGFDDLISSKMTPNYIIKLFKVSESDISGHKIEIINCKMLTSNHAYVYLCSGYSLAALSTILKSNPALIESHLFESDKIYLDPYKFSYHYKSSVVRELLLNPIFLSDSADFERKNNYPYQVNAYNTSLTNNVDITRLAHWA